MVLLTRNASARACRVGARQRHPNITHGNTFSTKTHSAISFPIRKKDQVPDGAVKPQKMMRLRSLQVDPPIQSTKKDLNVLAAVSLKTQTSLLRSPALKNRAHLDSVQHWPPSFMKNIQRKDGNRSSWLCNSLISFDEANS